ncbi:MAG: PIN domain-containing protein [Rhodocyclaceae bacterium]|nr:PIN domain-containing protein [Rhodocyclaceae bacterium]
MVIADTGFWVSLLWRRDPWHLRVREAYTRYADEGFISTWPVLTETCYLLGRSVGEDAKLGLLERVVDHSIQVCALVESDALRMTALMRRYADLPMDLADASLVVLAERLGHGRILSTDTRDFGAYRWKNHQPFINLLSPGET